MIAESKFDSLEEKTSVLPAFQGQFVWEER